MVEINFSTWKLISTTRKLTSTPTPASLTVSAFQMPTDLLKYLTASADTTAAAELNFEKNRILDQQLEAEVYEVNKEEFEATTVQLEEPKILEVLQR